MSSVLDELNRYLDEIDGSLDLTQLDLSRTAAERGWGAVGSCFLLRQHFGMTLSEAKGLTYQLCAEHGLQAVYEAACLARNPEWPHAQKESS